MSGTSGPTGPADPATLIGDWITIWKSEAAALGVDRELQEGLARLAGSWAKASMPPAGPPAGPAAAGDAADAPGRPGADAAARPAAAADAPDAQPATVIAGLLAELALLRGELAGLRQRIERLESRRRGPKPRASPPHAPPGAA